MRGTADRRSGSDAQRPPPTTIRELQEWKCYCSHHTGSGQQDTDSAIVAIRNICDNELEADEEQERTVPLWPSVTTTREPNELNKRTEGPVLPAGNDTNKE
jgi:hypothetical protein